MVLAAPPAAESSGPQRFEVVAPRAPAFAAPSQHARLLRERLRGEEVVADSQSYHGWVKLADRGGWMLAVGPEGVELRCTHLEELEVRRVARRAARVALSEAFATGDPDSIQAAIARARSAGAEESSLKAAEEELAA